MTEQEAVGVSEFQRMVPFLFLFCSSCVRLYPSSRLLVVVFYPVSTLRQTIPIFWASEFCFKQALYVSLLPRGFFFLYDISKGTWQRDGIFSTISLSILVHAVNLSKCRFRRVCRLICFVERSMGSPSFPIPGSLQLYLGRC